MKNTMDSRRDFIKKATIGAAAFSVGGAFTGVGARSYAIIVGANDRIRVGMMGVNARGLALANNYASQPNCEIAYICDVDSRAADKCAGEVEGKQGQRPALEGDIRKLLEKKDFDALVVATPDHWHAPAAIMASQAGKHVYLEKPASHNPNEGELLIAAQKKYGN